MYPKKKGKTYNFLTKLYQKMGKEAINVSTKIQFLTFSIKQSINPVARMNIFDKSEPYLPLEKTPKDCSKL